MNADTLHNIFYRNTTAICSGSNISWKSGSFMARILYMNVILGATNFPVWMPGKKKRFVLPIWSVFRRNRSLPNWRRMNPNLNWKGRSGVPDSKGKHHLTYPCRIHAMIKIWLREGSVTFNIFRDYPPPKIICCYQLNAMFKSDYICRGK